MLSNKEKFIFTSELALAISNGLQIEEGLKMLAGFDAGVSHCAKKLMDITKDGNSFVDALKQSNDFDEYMIQMVVVGQSIGNLDVVLKELSVYYERQKKLNYQIQDAITYPFVLILMMFVIVAALIFTGSCRRAESVSSSSSQFLSSSSAESCSRFSSHRDNVAF